jgi:hypothetical protein
MATDTRPIISSKFFVQQPWSHRATLPCSATGSSHLATRGAGVDFASRQGGEEGTGRKCHCRPPLIRTHSLTLYSC